MNLALNSQSVKSLAEKLYKALTHEKEMLKLLPRKIIDGILSQKTTPPIPL